MSGAAARRLATVVMASAALAVANVGAGTRVSPSDLVRDIKGLDGKQVTVTGTLKQVRTHISKKGERSYSFGLSDDRATIAVLSPTLPICRPGTRVTAHGIVDGRARRLDAATIACL